MAVSSSLVLPSRERRSLRVSSFSSQERRKWLTIPAYKEASHYIFLAALILTAIPVVAGFFTSNFYLDTRHNTIEDKVIVMRSEEETDEAVIREKVQAVEEAARRELGIAPAQALHQRR